MPTVEAYEAILADVKQGAERRGFEMVVEVGDGFDEEDVAVTFTKDGRTSVFDIQMHPAGYYAIVNETVWSPNEDTPYGSVLGYGFLMGAERLPANVAPCLFEKLDAHPERFIPDTVEPGQGSHIATSLLLNAIKSCEEDAGELEVVLNPEGAKLEGDDVIIINHNDREIKVSALSRVIKVETDGQVFDFEGPYLAATEEFSKAFRDLVVGQAPAP